MIDWYPPWRTLPKLRAHSHKVHSVLSYLTLHWMHVRCACSFGTVLAHHPSSINPHRLRFEYCRKKTGCFVFPFVLCLLFYHNVPSVRSELFHSELFPAVFSLLFQQLKWTFFLHLDLFLHNSLYHTRLLQLCTNFWIFCSNINFFSRWLPRPWAPSGLLSLALQRVKCACPTYIETRNMHIGPKGCLRPCPFCLLLKM